MDRETIGIVGLGLMGQNIAIACMSAGYRVVAHDSMPDCVPAFKESHPEFAGDFSQAHTFHDFRPCTLIIEAVAEDLHTKLEIFAQLERSAPNATIASNSSTFMPSELAIGLADKSTLLNCHFFNPADIVPLVEIVPSPFTDPARVISVIEFVRVIGKKPALLNHEVEGFVANRLQAAVLRESYSLIERGIVSAEMVDEVVRFSLAPRWAANGPVATADLGGLDVFEALSDRLFPLLDRSTAAQETLRQHVQSGQLGAKTGEGVYTWPTERRQLAISHLAEFFRLGEQQSSSCVDSDTAGAITPVDPTDTPWRKI